MNDIKKGANNAPFQTTLLNVLYRLLIKIFFNLTDRF